MRKQLTNLRIISLNQDFLDVKIIGLNFGMLYEQLTHKIISCAMKVHSAIGNGFQEVIYQRALAIEFRYEGVEFTREHEMQIYYRDEEIGIRRVDFFVEQNIMVEIKEISHLEEAHLAQAMNYLQAYNLPVGLLINFGARSMEFKRVYNLTPPVNKEFVKSNPNPKIN